jgi:hypothetical protein
LSQDEQQQEEERREREQRSQMHSIETLLRGHHSVGRESGTVFSGREKVSRIDRHRETREAAVKPNAFGRPSARSWSGVATQSVSKATQSHEENEQA